MTFLPRLFGGILHILILVSLNSVPTHYTLVHVISVVPVILASAPCPDLQFI